MAARGRHTERAAAWILVAFAAASAWFGAVDPIRRSFGDLRAEIGQTEDLAARYEAVLAGEPTIAALEAALAASQAAGAHLVAESAELAAAELQDRVRAAFAAQGLRAESMLILAEPDAGWVGLRVRFRADLPRLAQLLGSLEGVAPVTVVRRIAVGREASAGAAEEGSWPDLGVSLDLRAAVRLAPPAEEPAP